MSLYPSLEDMKVDHMQQVQNRVEANMSAATNAAITYPSPYPVQGEVTYPGTAPPPYTASPAAPSGGGLYPSLDEYMGLTPAMLDEHMAVVQQTMAQENNSQVAVKSSGSSMVAPITGNAVGLRRAEIKQGIREVILCKDGEGKIGLRVRSVNKGIFVAFVHANSPASMGGLRFGDQILQINGETCAGWDTDKAMKKLTKAAPERITFAIRDRPFERTITMQKDSTGHIGFVFKNGKITALVKDSSAARNGVLTDHQLVEVNGQNVVGLKDKEVGSIIEAGDRTVTITIIPTFLYDHIVKSMGSSLVKKYMDHSIPDV